MSKNEELIQAIKDAENAVTKALTALKKIAADTQPEPRKFLDKTPDQIADRINDWMTVENDIDFDNACREEAKKRLLALKKR